MAKKFAVKSEAAGLASDVPTTNRQKPSALVDSHYVMLMPNHDVL